MSVSHAAAFSVTSVKLLLAPCLIGVASWVGRRWGPEVAGWFAALPHTSGPLVLVVALERGPSFASEVCSGIALALVSLAAFAIVYAWASRRFGWAASAAQSCVAYLVCTWPLHRFHASLGASFVIACLALAAAILLMPRGRQVRSRRPSPTWDIPLRMVLAAALVSSLAAAATLAGPRLSGLLTPFPIAATILAGFTHHFDGRDAAVQFLRSLLTGLFSFAVFFLVVGGFIEPYGIGPAFLAAVAAATATHAAIWLVSRSRLTFTTGKPAS